MYCIKNLMANTDTPNDMPQPSRSRKTSLPMMPPPSLKNFKIFKKLAPNITGIPRKKVNSPLAVPIRSAPMIVAPERDVPGISAST